MSFQDIENIIVKYLTDEANTSDLDFLSQWIEKKEENKKIFKSYVKINYKVRSAIGRADVDKLKDKLLQQIKKDKNPFYRYKINSVLKYVAVAIVIVGFGYLYQTQNNIDLAEPDDVQEGLLIPKEELITVQLDNGAIQTIDLDKNISIKDAQGKVVGNQNSSRLTYNGSTNMQELVYNTLNIPNGKRFDLVLSDGTHIFLNSGTSIRYPIKFIDGKSRDVFITGEAYFDVAKDKNKPFIVHANEMNVKVLGTKFNISHYSESENINTVLVEGSVEIFCDDDKRENIVNSTVLKPGYKAEWNKTNRKIAIKNVDTFIYTAWIDGKLIFRNASFKHIRNTLERHYNVSIKNNNNDLDLQLFDATFDIENIDEILETFSKSYDIKYDIIDNEVIID